MTQTSTIPTRNGTLSATFAGTRKIPEPITDPTTDAERRDRPQHPG